MDPRFLAFPPLFMENRVTNYSDILKDKWLAGGAVLVVTTTMMAVIVMITIMTI